MTDLTAATIDAWTRWDRLPGAESTAGALADALGELAAELGVPSNELRAAIRVHRRNGLGIPESVRAAVEGASS